MRRRCIFMMLLCASAFMACSNSSSKTTPPDQMASSSKDAGTSSKDKGLVTDTKVNAKADAKAEDSSNLQTVAPGTGFWFNLTDPNITYRATLMLQNEAGEPVAKAMVKVDNQIHLGLPSGIVEFAAQVGKIQQAEVIAPGYASTTVTIDVTSTGQAPRVVKLIKHEVSKSFDTTSSTSISSPKVQVSIGANALELADGKPYSGKAELGLSTIDPGDYYDVQNQKWKKELDLESLPSLILRARDKQGKETFQMPLGALQVTFSAGDLPLRLKANQSLGVTATLPKEYLGTFYNLGDQHKLWTLDAKAGYWVESGSCTIKTDSNGEPTCAGSASQSGTLTVMAELPMRCLNVSPIKVQLPPNRYLVTRKQWMVFHSSFTPEGMPGPSFYYLAPNNQIGMCALTPAKAGRVHLTAQYSKEKTPPQQVIDYTLRKQIINARGPWLPTQEIPAGDLKPDELYSVEACRRVCSKTEEVTFLLDVD